MRDRRLAAAALTAAAALLLTGCASLFEREYIYLGDPMPTAQSSQTAGEKTAVRTLSELKQVLLEMVSAGESERRVAFDSAYAGDVTEDLDSACWQVRTQDALCAYCVENISYDLNQIVTFYEAEIHVSYSAMAQDLDSIVHMQYSTGIDDVIKDAIREGRNRLVVLISRSSYSAEGVELLVSQVYRSDPGIAPREPLAGVNLYSGTGLQRLYDISLSYGLASEELEQRRNSIQELDPFAELDTDSMDEAHRAMAACEYLAQNCRYTEDPQFDNIYSALIMGQSGSTGMALAYVELCNRLELDCRIVSGQRNWTDYSWNIISVDGEYYHVDPAACAELGLEAGFLLQDENMWGAYRWDMSSYPTCTGSLNYWALAGVWNQDEPDEPGQDDPSGEEVPGTDQDTEEGGTGEAENPEEIPGIKVPEESPETPSPSPEAPAPSPETP